MSLQLRRIALENFRKFRQPHEIAGLTAGLNIVIEPNETGKSTLLDAVRAALFLKHGSKTRLISSFQPTGDNVGPQVTLDFEIGGAPWSLTKRFLKSPTIDLAGPQGRQQGEAAEQALQALLGFETGAQGSSFEKDLHGALGMLWVAQMDGLTLKPPCGTVRDLIGATLEGEAGAIVGSAAFDRVSARVEAQYLNYYTARSGAATGRLAAARTRFAEAADTLAAAQQREEALEAAFAELEQTRQALQSLRRELDDGQDSAHRADLIGKLETARGAAQQLTTRRAEAAATGARLASLEDLSSRHGAALERQTAAQAQRDAAVDARQALAAELDAARARTTDARSELEHARTTRDAARTALALARAQALEDRRRSGIAAAHDRYRQVGELEADRPALAKTVAAAVPDTVLEDLAAAEREVVRHRTLLEADGTRVELVGSADTLTRDGLPMAPGEWTLTRETRIGLPGGSELVLRPSQALAGAQAALDAATSRHAAMLAQWQLESLADAQRRNEAAREAQRTLGTLAVQIAALTPAEPDLDLETGLAALSAFVAAHPQPSVAAPSPARPLAELETALDAAETAYTRAEARLRQAEQDLRDAEKAETPLVVEQQTASSDLTRVAEEIATLHGHPDFVELTVTLAEAREANAGAAVALAGAEANVRAFDEDALRRQIDKLDARRRAAEESRSALLTRIARLEAQIESDGGKGLAEQVALARDEDEAARAALVRMEEEAETLRLLRDTLAEAATETARTITGPVAARAARYIGRVLPGSEAAFADDLGLSTIRRAGMDEPCEQLSRGTQEQLAILTRLAFADMMLEEGRPVSLILDDPLVYSDDVRLDGMTDLILEASQRMQVILLTCRERAFRHVEGTRIRM